MESCLLCLFILLFRKAHAATSLEPMDYLVKYGYLPQVTNGGRLQQAVKEFQMFAGINTTGALDMVTRMKMSEQRCGMVDRPPLGVSYSASSVPKWSMANLTYVIENYTPDIEQHIVEAVIARALLLWSNVTSLTFTRLHSQAAHMKFSFKTRDHGDGVSFDGPGGVLAHAFPPPSGVTHFDDDEFFTFQSSTGINFLWLAAHEIGHALGLQHSSISGSLMYPFYDLNTRGVALHLDDINQIQMRYGKPDDARQDKTTLAPSVSPAPATLKVCTDSYPSNICASWAKGGHCKTNSGVRKLCSKTCDSC